MKVHYLLDLLQDKANAGVNHASMKTMYMKIIDMKKTSSNEGYLPTPH